MKYFSEFKVDTKQSYRLIMALDGLEKQGKTHFSFTAPDPIAYFDLNIGSEGVIEKFPHKKIYKFELPARSCLDKIDIEKCALNWEKYKQAYFEALESPIVRTIIIDTATEAWELIRLAKFGKLSQVKPHHYGPVNMEFSGLTKMAFAHNKNLILVHKMKAKYENDKRVNGYERAGFSDTGFLVQCNIEMFRDDESNEFGICITDCRQNIDLSGEEFTGEMCSFPILAMMIYPESTPEDWE